MANEGRMTKRPNDEETWAFQKMWAENMSAKEVLNAGGPVFFLSLRHGGAFFEKRFTQRHQGTKFFNIFALPS